MVRLDMTRRSNKHLSNQATSQHLIFWLLTNIYFIIYILYIYIYLILKKSVNFENFEVNFKKHKYFLILKLKLFFIFSKVISN